VPTTSCQAADKFTLTCTPPPPPTTTKRAAAAALTEKCKLRMLKNVEECVVFQKSKQNSKIHSIKIDLVFVSVAIAVRRLKKEKNDLLLLFIYVCFFGIAFKFVSKIVFWL
jgi:hypothetical protein